MDLKMIEVIENNLKSDLNLTPNNDGKVIRLILPELTAERRYELVSLPRKNRRGQDTDCEILGESITILKEMERMEISKTTQRLRKKYRNN